LIDSYQLCVDMRAAGFKHSLLSVDVNVCMWLCVCMYVCPHLCGSIYRNL